MTLSNLTAEILSNKLDDKASIAVHASILGMMMTESKSSDRLSSRSDTFCLSVCSAEDL